MEKLIKKRAFYIALILISNLSLFTFGLAIGKFKFFPYSLLLSSYQSLKELPIWSSTSNNDFLNINLGIDPSELEKSLQRSLTLAKTLRQKTLNRVILEKKMVVFKAGPVLQNQQKIETSFYGIKIKSILSKANKKSSNKSCLRVYIQGHGGDPFDFDYHGIIRSSSLTEGCDFLSMSMLGLGLNEDSVSFPRNNITINLSTKLSKNHLNYSYFRDTNSPDWTAPLPLERYRIKLYKRLDALKRHLGKGPRCMI